MDEQSPNPIADLLTQTQRYFSFQKEVYGNEMIVTQPDIVKRFADSFQVSSLEEFYQSIKTCQKCALSQSRTHFVFGAGNPNANLMLIGEAPGREEDLKGKPFVGQAGQLLDKILKAIDFNRKEIFIANILKCRPPQNRDPLPEEITICFSYLQKQIELIRPRIILILGRIAAHTLLRTEASLTSLRDKTHSFQNIPALVTYHPAALLRNPQWKKFVWEDVQKLRKMYDEIVKDKPKWQPPKR